MAAARSPALAEPGAGAHPHRLDTVLLVLLGAGLFLVLKLNQWQSLGVHAELAEFESRLHSTLHGAFMQRHPGEPAFFGEHFAPVLLLLLPFYALWPSPVTLLSIQALAAAAAAAPLHRLALGRLGGRLAAAAVSLAYLVSRLLGHGLMYDFHMEIFYPLAFFTAFLAFEGRRWGWTTGALLLALACKEDAAVAVSGFGIYVLARGERRAGMAIAAAGLAWLLVVVKLVMPAFRGGAGAGGYPFAFYWSGYGDTPAAILRGMLNPVTQARVLFAPPKPGQMLDLFAGVLFLPFADLVAAACLVLPGCYILYSSDNPVMNGPILYYGLLLLPFLFYAALLGMRRLGRNAGSARGRWITVLAGALLAVQLGNSRLFRLLSPDAFGRHARTASVRRLIALIPSGVPVSAQINLVSYLPVASDRRYLPDGLERAEAALFDTLGYSWPLEPAANRALLARLEGSDAWRHEAAVDGMVLLRRRHRAPAAPP